MLADRYIQLEFFFFFNVNGISSCSTLFFHYGSIPASNLPVLTSCTSQANREKVQPVSLVSKG